MSGGFDGGERKSFERRAFEHWLRTGFVLECEPDTEQLAELRDIDFPRVSASSLSIRQVEIIGSRYNRGPEATRRQIEQNTSYGKSIARRWELLNQLVR